MATMVMMTSNASAEQEDEESVGLSSTSTCTINWKLYDNPFYQNPSQSHFHKHLLRKYSASAKHIHRLQRDLKFECLSLKTSSELDQAHAQIAQLKEELDFERKLRKKVESLNKMMARELMDQRRKREKMCDDLKKEITQLKAEVEKKKTEVEEERKMLKMAEALREERLQMKLSDAKLFNPEKVLPITQKTPSYQRLSNQKPCTASSSSSSSTSSSSSSLSKTSKRSMSTNVSASQSLQRKGSPEAENPHIKRGIKGFVEFPRVVKAINGPSSSHNSRNMGTKLECQKAQLKILMNQKSTLSSNNLVIS